MVINKAGVLIKKIENGKIYLLLLHLLKHDYWQIPKGHAEDNEALEQTAVREAEEETGYKVKLLKKLPSVNYLDNEKNKVNLNIFLAEIVDGELRAEKGHELKWILLEDAAKTFTYEDMKDFIKKAEGDIRST